MAPMVLQGVFVTILVMQRSSLKPKSEAQVVRDLDSGISLRQASVSR